MSARPIVGQLVGVAVAILGSWPFWIILGLAAAVLSIGREPWRGIFP